MREALFGLIVLGGLSLAAAAAAQTQQQIDWCYADSATDDQTIEGCTAMIQSGRYQGVELANAYNNRAAGYNGKRQLELAIQDDLLAIQLNPLNAQAFHNLGDDYYAKSNFDTAITDYTRALAIKPDYAKAYLGRAKTYEQKGLRDAAIADYRSAMQYSLTQAEARAGLIRLGQTP